MSKVDGGHGALRYTAPSHVDWGLVRIAALVPESHMLFVCPSACGRHGALGAVDQGYKHRVSYIFVYRQDIIDGYDNVIREGVSELLEQLPKAPPAIMVFVSCIDDLIGTDLDALMIELHDARPDIEFRAGHMNPISLDGTAPPPVTAQNAMFDFLKPSEIRDADAVNFIGSFVDVLPVCEVYEFLAQAGFPLVRHISRYDTFEGFLEMAKSAYNISLWPPVTLAARSMEKKLGIPFLSLCVSYDLDEIAADYHRLSEFLGGGADYDFAPHIAKAERAIENALQIVGDRPITISNGAVWKPFGLAKVLIEHGFNVESVVADEIPAFDRAAYDFIASRGVTIFDPQAPDTILRRHENAEAVAIGYDAAYIAGSCHIVDLANDMGMFGYHGVWTLMGMIAAAAETESDLAQLMADFGGVI
ncbi:MAG: nitrogenase component 1 [Clostridiales Family XIII bacterium]|jgi:hypothetical protein|nr:nitrogenase component 1 [Clostridiales Family XIII bacterium]